MFLESAVTRRQCTGFRRSDVIMLLEEENDFNTSNLV